MKNQEQSTSHDKRNSNSLNEGVSAGAGFAGMGMNSALMRQIVAINELPDHIKAESLSSPLEDASNPPAKPEGRLVTEDQLRGRAVPSM